MARPQWEEAIRPWPCHCFFHLLPATSLPAALFTLDTSSGNNTAQAAGLGWRAEGEGTPRESAYPGTGAPEEVRGGAALRSEGGGDQAWEKKRGCAYTQAASPRFLPASSLWPSGPGLAGVRPRRWRSTTVVAWPPKSDSCELVAWLNPLLAPGPGQAFSP